jgi:hypothetical protein
MSLVASFIHRYLDVDEYVRSERRRERMNMEDLLGRRPEMSFLNPLESPT